MKNNLAKKELQERVLMMMKYDMNKTQDENKITLKEDTGDIQDTTDIANQIWDQMKGNVKSDSLTQILNLLKQRVFGKKFRDGSTCLLSKVLEFYKSIYSDHSGILTFEFAWKMNGDLVHDIKNSSETAEPGFPYIQTDLINAINTELNSANCRGSGQSTPATQNNTTTTNNTTATQPKDTSVKPPLPNLPDISTVQKEEHGFPACIKGQNPKWDKLSDGTWQATFSPEGIKHNYPQDFPKLPTFTAWANGRVKNNDTGEMGTFRCADTLTPEVIQQNTDLGTASASAAVKESKKILRLSNFLIEDDSQPASKGNDGLVMFWDKNYNVGASPTTQTTSPTQKTNTSGQQSSTTTNPAGNQNNFYQIPGPLGNTNGVKSFQDWLDTNHPGWHKKYGVLDKNVPKGYGTYGPQTTLAWSQFGQQYLSSNGKTQPQVQSQNTNTNSTVQAPTIPTPVSAAVGPTQSQDQPGQSIATDNNTNVNNDNTDPNLNNVQGTDQVNNNNTVTDQGTQVPQQQQVYSQQSQGYVAPPVYYNQLVNSGHIIGNPGDRHLTYNGPQLNQRQLNAINNQMKTTGYGFVRNPGNNNNGQRFTWQKGAPFYTRGGGNNGGGFRGGGFRGRR